MATTKPPSLLDLRTPADIAGFPGLPKPKPVPKTKPKPRAKRSPGPIPNTEKVTYPNKKTKVVYSGTNKAVDPESIAAYKQAKSGRSAEAVVNKKGETVVRRGREATVDKQGKLRYPKTNVKQRVATDSANTLSLGGLAERVSSGVIGPNITNAVQGKGFNPYMVPVEALGVFPFARAARTLETTAHVAGALRAGASIEEAQTIARAGLRGHNPAPLVLQIGKKGTEASKTLTGPASRSPVSRSIQRAAVKVAQRKIGNPETTPLEQQLEAVSKGLPAKVAKHLTKNEQFYGNVVERGPAEALVGQTLRTPREVAQTVIRGAGITSPKQMALKLVSEETTPANYIKTMESELAAAKNSPHHFADVARIRRNIKLAKIAEKRYIDVLPAGRVSGKFASKLKPNELTSVLKPPTDKGMQALHNTWNDITFVSGRREATKLRMGDFESKTGKFTPEQIMAMRKGLPRLVDQGARQVPITTPFDPLNTGGKHLVEGRPVSILGHEGNEVRVRFYTRGKRGNYTKTVQAEDIQKVTGQRFEWPDGTPVTPDEMMAGGRVFISGKIGRVRGAGKAQTVSEMLPAAPMGETKARYGGVARVAGRENINVTQRVGQDTLAAQRSDRFMRELKPLQAMAIRSPVKPSKGSWTLAKLTRNPSPKSRQLMDDALQKADNGIVLNKDEAKSISKDMSDWADSWLPQDAPADLEDFGWVPSSLVGDLKKPFIVRGANEGPAINVAKYVAGSLNDIVKASLIYAKFGYIAPNLAGNLALNAFQQGPEIFPTLITVARMAKKDSWVSRYADTQMGSGVMQSFLAGNPERRFSQRTLGALAHIQSVPTDRYTRRASYFYEFAKATGIGVTDQKGLAAAIRTLSRAEPGSEGARLMTEVAQRARLAAIEYERMTATERKYVASWLFIYPWMKGATRYSFAFPFEHPVQAAALATAWKINEERNKRMIANYGGRPPWQEHITAVAGSSDNPVVTNWGNILPFTSAEEVVKAGASIFQGHPPGFAEGPASLISPAITQAEEAIYGRNPMTGTQLSGNPWAASALDFAKQSPIYSDFFGPAPKPTSPTQRSRVQHLVHAFLGAPSPTTIAPRNFSKKKKSSKRSGYSGGSSYSGSYSGGGAYGK